MIQTWVTCSAEKHKPLIRQITSQVLEKATNSSGLIGLKSLYWWQIFSVTVTMCHMFVVLWNFNHSKLLSKLRIHCNNFIIKVSFLCLLYSLVSLLYLSLLSYIFSLSHQKSPKVNSAYWVLLSMCQKENILNTPDLDFYSLHSLSLLITSLTLSPSSCWLTPSPRFCHTIPSINHPALAFLLNHVHIICLALSSLWPSQISSCRTADMPSLFSLLLLLFLLLSFTYLTILT